MRRSRPSLGTLGVILEKDCAGKEEKWFRLTIAVRGHSSALGVPNFLKIT